MTTTTVKDTSFKTLKTIQLSDPQRFGYAALRIRRDAIIDALTAAARSVDVPINYGYNLVDIVENGIDVARCRFDNGAEKSVSLVVGADGLRSRVRKVSFPNAPAPAYTGQAGLMWSVPRGKLNFPLGSGLDASRGAASMMTPQGVVLFVPDSVDGVDMRIGTQRPVQELDVSGWKALAEDRKAYLSLLRQDGEEIPEPVESAIKYAESNDEAGVFLWPFYFLSTMDGWISRSGNGRVVLIGDAAHAFPPSGGQGAGMAIEDAEGLGLILGEMGKNQAVKARLEIWQKWRKQRIDRVTEYTAQLGKSRVAKPVLATAEESTAKQTKPANPLGDLDELAWLYDWRSKEQLKTWMGQENTI